jgi:hypothetical protein
MKSNKPISITCKEQNTRKKNKNKEEKHSSSNVHDPQPSASGIFCQSHQAQ